MRVLIIPQFSMRSYKTGTYSLLADGNLNLVLHQIFNSTKTNEYVITIPKDHVREDLEVIKEKILPNFDCKVTFMEIPYGIHADANRTVVPRHFDNFSYFEFAYVISYFENLRPDIPWVLKMSMSKIKELDRPYADKHYNSFIEALGHHWLIRADVLNYSQYEMVKLTDPELLKNVNVNEQCLNRKFYDILREEFVDQDIVAVLNEVVPDNALFFPFRISDKAYDFERASMLGRPVVVTDPNESLQNPDVIKLTGDLKVLLFSMLELMKTRTDIDIPLYEDCELAVHQLIIEVAYSRPGQLLNINTGEIIERYTF